MASWCVWVWVLYLLALLSHWRRGDRLFGERSTLPRFDQIRPKQLRHVAEKDGKSPAPRALLRTFEQLGLHADCGGFSSIMAISVESFSTNSSRLRHGFPDGRHLVKSLCCCVSKRFPDIILIITVSFTHEHNSKSHAKTTSPPILPQALQAREGHSSAPLCRSMNPLPPRSACRRCQARRQLQPLHAHAPTP